MHDGKLPHHCHSTQVQSGACLASKGSRLCEASVRTASNRAVVSFPPNASGCAHSSVWSLRPPASHLHVSDLEAPGHQTARGNRPQRLALKDGAVPLQPAPVELHSGRERREGSLHPQTSVSRPKPGLAWQPRPPASTAPGAESSGGAQHPPQLPAPGWRGRPAKRWHAHRTAGAVPDSHGRGATGSCSSPFTGRRSLNNKVCFLEAAGRPGASARAGGWGLGAWGAGAGGWGLGAGGWGLGAVGQFF